jgi:CRISPR-associated protein Cas5d
MLANGPPLEVRLAGEFACFTRPEMKVERVSYPVMTPSAARGALESIFWKPEFCWHVSEIWVLNPIRYISILRNEVKSRQSERAAAAWQASGGRYDAQADRTQRHTLALREVAYLVRAHLELRAGLKEDPARYRDQFRRRVRDGRCFATPYLGCREFAATFGERTPADTPIDQSDNLGPMLLDLVYDKSGRARPVFFEAVLDRGILRVPPSAEPQRLEEG